METKLCCCTETHLNRSFSAAYFSVTLVASFFEYKFESSTRPFSRLSFIKHLNGFLYSLTFLLLLLMFLTLSPHPATLFSSGANHVIFSSFFSCSLHTHTPPSFGFLFAVPSSTSISFVYVSIYSLPLSTLLSTLLASSHSLPPSSVYLLLFHPALVSSQRIQLIYN